MGQATRTTKLLDLGRRDQGGANLQKRAALDATAEVLTAARAFYIDFFLAHAGKFSEQVSYYSEEHLELRERLISAHELLSWAEACTVETAAHPHPWAGWNFKQRFPGMPFTYRRSVIKDAIGKVRSYFLVLMPSSLSPNNYDHNPRNCEILHSQMPLNASGSLWVHHLVECLMDGRKLIIPGTGLPIIKHVCWRDPGWQGHLDALG
jgi:hypothetical protein